MPKKEKVKSGRDSQSSISNNRVNLNNLKQKEKHSVENQDFQNYESNVSHESNEGIAAMDPIKSLETDAQVGAFSVAGNRGGESYEDEENLQETPLPQIQPIQNPMAVKITNAQLIDDAVVFTDIIVNATPIKGFCMKGWILRCMLIAIVSMLLLMAIIIPSVILTRKLLSNTPNADTGSIARNDTKNHF
jgi:hypothetical protein